MKKIIFVVTTPFAVNTFLTSNLNALAIFYKVTLLTNLKAHSLTSSLSSSIDVFNLNIQRKIDLVSDSIIFCKVLWKLLKERPSAVHSVTPKAGLLLISAAFLARVPIRTHSFTGQVWANKNGIYRRFLQLIDKLIVRLSTHILADSFSQRSYLEAQGIVKSGVITVLGKGSIGGVDLVRFRPNRITRQSKRLAIGTSVSTIVYLFVGRVTREKGISDLLSAFQKVASAIAAVELWIVGPKEEVFEEKFKGLADETASGVRWLGSTDKPEEYMAAADLLVLPSYREGFGTVIIEASACQLPIIAYKTQGVVDAVLDGNSGVLVSKYDVEALSNAMIWLASNSELRNQMGLNGLDFVKRNYSSDLIALEWVQFYKRIFSDISMVRN